jgi:UDP-glucose 4-epimerase
VTLTFLLTGSTGYIGWRLSEHLSQHGIVVEVNRSAGYDLSEPGWTKHLPSPNVDIVIHLAQSKRYREFPAGAQDMFRVNVASTAELLEWARSHKVKRFVFSSSGNIYKPSTSKLTETAERTPGSMYAATKLASENLLQPYSTFFQIVIARLFTVYGPGQRQMLIANMIERVRSDQEITLASGVGPYLTPVFIADVIGALTRLAMAPLPHPVNILNIASNEMLSLAEIVSEIGNQLNKSPKTRITNEETRYFCGENTALKSYYGDFVPFKVGLEQTLRQNDMT